MTLINLKDLTLMAWSKGSATSALRAARGTLAEALTLGRWSEASVAGLDGVRAKAL